MASQIVNLGKQPTLADVLSMSGEQSAIAPHIKYPTTNPEKAEQDTRAFQQRLLRLAAGVPAIADTSFLPPVVFFEDFIDTASPAATTTGGKFDVAADTSVWLVTEVDGGTGQTETVIGIPIDGAAGASAEGGWGAFTTCNADNDGLSAQVNGEAFKLAVGYPLWFEAKWAVEDVSESEIFVGLAISTTDAYGTAGAGTTGGHVGFVMKGAGTTTELIYFNVMESTKTLVQTSTAISFVDGSITTFETANVVHRCGFYWDGEDTITPYVDGVAITAAAVSTLTAAQLVTAGKIAAGNVSADIPDGVCMSPAFSIMTQGNTSETIWMDYIAVAQGR